MTKKNLMEWCNEYKINWYGEGTYANINYCFKIILGKGHMGLFVQGLDDGKSWVININNRIIPVIMIRNPVHFDVSHRKFKRYIDEFRNILSDQNRIENEL